MTAPLLSLEDVQASYGNAPALFGISLKLEEGSVLAVVGSNGAGKSTLARAISGLVPISAGRVRFGGQDITGWRPHRIRQLGISYVPEERGVFPDLSVLENLRMSVRWIPKRQRNAGIEESFAMFPVLHQRSGQRAGSLSGGEQQMLAIARSLAVRPRLLIADELSLGLAPMLVNQTFTAIEAARDRNITIVLIEQYVEMALRIADDCIVLRRGSVSWSGAATDAGPEVLSSYLGEGPQAADAPGIHS